MCSRYHQLAFSWRLLRATTSCPSTRTVQTFRRVAQNLLDMSEVDVLLVGEMHPSKPGRAKERLALIGRARARIEAVDLNALFQRRA